MKALLSRVWNAEPVRLLAGVEAIVAAVVTGLVVFDVWNPKPDQLAYVTGATATLGAAFGWQVVRKRVTPWKPPAPPADAGFVSRRVVGVVAVVGVAAAAGVAVGVRANDGLAENDDVRWVLSENGDRFADIIDRYGLTCQVWEIRNFNRDNDKPMRTAEKVEIPPSCLAIPTTTTTTTPAPTTTPPPTSPPPTSAPSTTVVPTTTIAPTTTTTTPPSTTVPPSGDWVPYLSGLSPASNEVLSQPFGFFGGPGVGETRFLCGVSHIDYGPDDAGWPLVGWDPIVAPNGLSGHSHTFWGNVDTNPDTTTRAHLRDGDGGSTCQGGAMNKSAYWVPTLLDGAGGIEIPDNIFVYYKVGYWGQDAPSIQLIPEGLKMISTPFLPNGVRQTGWGCTGANEGSDFLLEIPDCRGGYLTASILMQQCWNGVDLDSPDHRSHMAHPMPGSPAFGGGQCPDSHPVLLPQITAHVQWEAPASGTADWLLSSDVQNETHSGRTLHADFFEGWDRDLHRAGVENCLHRSLDCGVGALGDGLYRPLP